MRTPVAGAPLLVHVDHAVLLVAAAVQRAHLPCERQQPLWVRTVSAGLGMTG